MSEREVANVRPIVVWSRHGIDLAWRENFDRFHVTPNASLYLGDLFVGAVTFKADTLGTDWCAMISRGPGPLLLGYYATRALARATLEQEVLAALFRTGEANA